MEARGAVVGGAGFLDVGCACFGEPAMVDVVEEGVVGHGFIVRIDLRGG